MHPLPKGLKTMPNPCAGVPANPWCPVRQARLIELGGGRRIRAPAALHLPAMSPIVVKLGSSIVADERGEVRADVLDPDLRRAGELQRGGQAMIVVTSGAIARGMGVMAAAAAAASDRRAAGRERRRPGQALPGLRRAAAGARRADRTGAADVLRHERPHALPERAPDAAQAARVARRAGDQRERHHHDRRDLVRQQRLPRRPGGDPARGRAAAAADRRRRRVHRRSALDTPTRELVSEVAEFDELDGLDIGHATSPLGSGGMRSKVVAAEMATAAGIPTVIASGLRPGVITAAAPASTSARDSPPARVATRASSCG